MNVIGNVSENHADRIDTEMRATIALDALRAVEDLLLEAGMNKSDDGLHHVNGSDLGSLLRIISTEIRGAFGHA